MINLDDVNALYDAFVRSINREGATTAVALTDGRKAYVEASHDLMTDSPLTWGDEEVQAVSYGASRDGLRRSIPNESSEADALDHLYEAVTEGLYLDGGWAYPAPEDYMGRNWEKFRDASIERLAVTHQLNVSARPTILLYAKRADLRRALNLKRLPSARAERFLKGTAEGLRMWLEGEVYVVGVGLTCDDLNYVGDVYGDDGVRNMLGELLGQATAEVAAEVG